MDKKIICASVLPTLLLMACERDPAPKNEGVAASAQPQPANSATDPAPSAAVDNASTAGSVNGRNDTEPPLTAILTPEAERGIEGARNVLLTFARAIEQQRFDQAWSLLSPGDQQKWSKQQFAANFAGLKDIAVAIPTGATDGAAGSIYYTAPVTITGSDSNGRPIRMEGKAVLRRVNNVDGATPAQLRWHFDALRLDWTH